MALRREDVFPAVVVEVLQSNSPARTARRKSCKAGLQTGVGEGSSPFVPVQGPLFESEISHEHIRTSVVVVIGKNGAHTGVWLSIVGQRYAGVEPTFFERPVPVVVVQKLLPEVV